MWFLNWLFSFSGQSAEAVMLISSLRDVIRQQSVEIESLQKRLKEAENSTAQVSNTLLVVGASSSCGASLCMYMSP